MIPAVVVVVVVVVVVAAAAAVVQELPLLSYQHCLVKERYPIV